MATDRLISAIESMQFARGYTRQLLNGIGPDEWFWQPKEGVTHLAWQAAHLAVAEYGLAIKRLRGEKPDDEQVIPGVFLTRFGRSSVPDPDLASNPSVREILAVMDRVHDEAIRELSHYTDADLDVPSEPPHPAFTTKLGALGWCSQHELIHAGQIALLRRLMGKPPLR